MTVVEVKNLTKIYSRGDLKVQALQQVSFTVNQGQFVSVMGPSGSGKSTLLHLLGGLDKITSGEVYVGGKNINQMNDTELSQFRRRHLGFIFQFFNLLPTMSAIENVALPLLLDGKSLKDVEKKALELLDYLGLSHRIHHSPDQLSGGEMQRVAIARALVTEPSLILADEPTGNLDSKTGESVLKLLSQLSKDRKQTIIMVTHSKEAALFGHRLIEMKDGKIQNDKMEMPAWN
jgi:putative ABC transport system ATP-binding protein